MRRSSGTKRQSTNITSKRYLDRIQSPASLPSPLTHKERIYLMNLGKEEPDTPGLTNTCIKVQGRWVQVSSL